jgi:TonB family protein
MRSRGASWWTSIAVLALLHAGAGASEGQLDAAGAPSRGAPAKPRGSLDKEVIRGVIRGHLAEIKTCYERALVADQDLSGRVMVQFRIAASGKVVSAVVQSSTLGSPPVESCIADAVATWQFPAPRGGGEVIVSYPFILKDADAEPPRAPAGGCAERFATTPPASRAAGAPRSFDLDRLGDSVSALESIDAEYAFVPLLITMVEAWRGAPPTCGEAVDACKRSERSSRDYALIARACARCAGDLEPILALPPERRLAAIVERCAARAPDRVLEGALAAQRDKLDPFVYLLLRDLAGDLRAALERDGSPRALEYSARIRKLLPSIVKGMALEARLHGTVR